VIPDAPRVAGQGFPSHFSWNFLPAKFFDAPLKASQSEFNLSSNENKLKPSNSAFEILSRSESLNDVNEMEESSEKGEEPKVEKVDHPKTSR
jgi:hypothetical protein